MTLIENLDILVPVYSIDSESPVAFFIGLDKNRPLSHTIVEIREPYAKCKSKEEVYNTLENALQNIVAGKIWYTGKFAEKNAIESIRRNSHRGEGSIRYKNYIIYGGVSEMDCIAFITTTRNNEYWLFLHPQAYNYVEKVSTNS